MRWSSYIVVALVLACESLSGASGSVDSVVGVPASARTPSQQLAHADAIKISNHAEFVRVLGTLQGQALELAPNDRQHLQFLDAWALGYAGEYSAAIEQMELVSANAGDATLRMRAEATIVNFLQVSSRYEDALLRLSRLLSELPKASDQRVRRQVLGVATDIYNDVGNHELALSYSKQLELDAETPQDRCLARYARLRALVARDSPELIGAQLREGIALCMGGSNVLVANAIRALLVRRMLDKNEAAAAITELTSHYGEIQQTGYAELIAKVDSLLGLAYWELQDLTKASRHADKALRTGELGPGAKSFVRSYRVMYLVAKQRGDDAAALAWHEKYMAADTAYLNEVSAKALAFQKVNQLVLAKEGRIAALNDQNRILGLQQNLSAKSAETTRLYVLLLGVILSALAFWAWRVKRSQIAFRKLARRDSLTGIFNRQHFLDAARDALQYANRSDREACLILLDLDHFKQVNDDHGHAAGDSVLKRAVAACEKALRSVDVFGRLGGEEFGILVLDCRLDEGAARAEQMRLAIAAHASDGMPAVSASFGVASTLHCGHDLRELLAQADAALYRAKRSGRNAVAVSDDERGTASAANPVTAG